MLYKFTSLLLSSTLMTLTLSADTMSETDKTWEAFKTSAYHDDALGITLDTTAMGFSQDALASLKPQFNQAFAAMEQLEGGAIANPSEERQVGHYWLRNANLAPNPETTKAIKNTVHAVKQFAKEVHEGTIRGSDGAFDHLLLVGIGGSALGPQMVSQALQQPGKDKLKPYYIDNTDPDGVDLALTQLKGKLGKTLVLVISKSGGTAETYNGLKEVEHAYKALKIPFNQHAVAITGADSKLSKYAKEHQWVQQFPLWDWIGGRTSELSVVGLLPAALQGFDIEELLQGAKAMDDATRQPQLENNPAALMAASWYLASEGCGQRALVILPYKDRLSLLTKYMQQLVMESLGKEHDLNGNTVHQGLTVYGNKGSTDQHAYVQQLRDGLDNSFVTFIEVLRDRQGSVSPEVKPGLTSGDYLQAFLLGTQTALQEKNRPSMTLTLKELSAYRVGALIALYERTVGLYGSLININPYDQPGVEAGKKAANSILETKTELMHYLKAHRGQYFTAETLAKKLNKPQSTLLTYKLLEHIAANSRPVKKVSKEPFHESQYGYIG